MNKKPIVYLDMDGVIVDFVSGLHRALGLPYSVKEYPHPAGVYEMFPHAVSATVGRHTMESLLAGCSTVSFWENLRWDPLGGEILEIIESYGDEIYLTSYPMKDPCTWLGKLRWIDKHIPQYNNKVILMTAHKQLLAKPGTILVDDRDDNVDKFCAAGGSGYLVPQPWNSAHKKYSSNWLVHFDLWMKSVCKTTST